jgi:hypothetical protein
MDVPLPASLAVPMRHISDDLVRLGLRPAEHAFAGFLPGGNHATYALHVPADECATVVALATDNVQDVDAALYTPDGDLLAVDSESDRHPTIQVCVRESMDFYHVLQLYDGDGSFVVLPFFGPRATLAAAAHVLGGRPAFTEAVAVRELQRNPLADLAEGLRKRGFMPLGAGESLPIAEHERVRSELPAVAGECYTVAAVGVQGLRDLGMRILDESGMALAVDNQGPHEQVAVQLCAHATAKYTVELEARAGAGAFTLVTFHADVATAGGEENLWIGERPERHTQPPSAAP